MDVLINYMRGILSPCIRISNHHNLSFKYLTILCQLYLSKAEIKNILSLNIRLGKKEHSVTSFKTYIIEN